MTTSENGSIPQQDGGNEKGQQKQQPVAVHAVAIDIHALQDASMPAQARGLTWNDTYYADKNIEGVIAVFDINGDKIRRSIFFWFAFYIMILVGIGILLISMTPMDTYGDPSSYFTLFWIVYTAFITYTLVKQFKKMSKGINGLHVAVTKDGIRKDMNGYPFGNMFRTTTIIPYSEIKAIRVQRKWCCCCAGSVYIQSAEDDTWNAIRGLMDNADKFVPLVKALIARNAAVIMHDDVENQQQPTKE